MTTRENEPLVEEAAGAFRPRDARGQLGALAAWHDLDAEGRREAFAVAVQLRRVEAALDAEGLSTTARAVLSRIRK